MLNETNRLGLKFYESLPWGFPYKPRFISLGDLGSEEKVGCGFMLKDFSAYDHVNYLALQYSLVYIIQGEGEFWFDDKRTLLHPGMIFQRCPKVAHSTKIYGGTPWVECFIDFGPHFYESLCKMGLIRHGQWCHDIGLSQHWIDQFARCARMFDERAHQPLPLILSSCFQLLVNMLSAADQPQEKGDQEMIERAKQKFSQFENERFEIKSWCLEQGWDYDKFRRIFKKSTGLSPAQFRIRRRIDLAQQMILTHPNEKFNRFAEWLGYPSVYEYSAQFKKVVGMSPSQYRSMYAVAIQSQRS